MAARQAQSLPRWGIYINLRDEIMFRELRYARKTWYKTNVAARRIAGLLSGARYLSIRCRLLCQRLGLVWKYFVFALFLMVSNVHAGPPIFEPARLLMEVSGGNVRPFWTQDFGRKKCTEGHSVLVPQAVAKELLLKLRSRLPAGYVAFVGTTHNLDDFSVKDVELVLARGNEQFDIVRLAATDGDNYGITNEDIVSCLKEWDQKFGIDIWQAGTNTIQLDIKARPTDTRVFAKELYAFCPDIIDPETDGLAPLERVLRRQSTLFLWWD